ncbi:hypothetical protein RDI58_020853 [Solanum bulbocastanum]|uniref:Uncharacterized protein n=1 Tax=Solanum bulbocastanum TaxID=147425 RepID=A0AAN8Y893_SOLBU
MGDSSPTSGDQSSFANSSQSSSVPLCRYQHEIYDRRVSWLREGFVRSVHITKIDNSKQTIKQRGKIEGSIVQDHIERETGDFYSYYLGDDVSCRRNKSNRNDEGNIDPLFPPMSILIKMIKDLKNVYDECSSVQHLQLVKEVTLGPESQVLTVNKYCVNDFKFQIKEVSRNKKTNNSGVYIQGDVDDTGQTIEYYDVIQEIIEVRDKVDWWVVIKSKLVGRIEIDNVLDVVYQNDVTIVHQQVDIELETTQQHHQHILEKVSDNEILNMSSGSDGNRHREHLGLVLHQLHRHCIYGATRTYLYRLFIDHDPYWQVGYRMILHLPQLSAMRIGDSSSEQSDAIASTPSLTQRFVHPNVSPSSTTAPSAALNVVMPALAPGQKENLGRVMIESDGSSFICFPNLANLVT